MSAQTISGPNGATNGAPHQNEKLPKELVDEMQAIFGKHPGYRTSMHIRILKRDTVLILLLR